MADEILLYFGGLLAIVVIETVLIFLYNFFTPANTFLISWLKKDRLILHPGEDRYLRIQGTKRKGSMSEIKKQGFYITSPKDTYIEAKSKLPIAICYGKYSLSLDTKMADITKTLQEMGINNYEDLTTYMSLLQKQREKIENGEKPNVKLPDKITILGESVNMEDIVKYFSSTERSDVIEAEIQRRTAAEVTGRFKQTGELIKWAVFIMIVLIGAAIAYAILSQYLGNSAGGTTIINNFLNQTSTTIPGITSNTSLNITAPTGVMVT